MTKIERLLQEWMYRVEWNMENDKVSAQNRLNERSDNVDLIEMIEINVRCQTVSEIFTDLRNILKMARPPNKYI